MLEVKLETVTSEKVKKKISSAIDNLKKLEKGLSTKIEDDSTIENRTKAFLTFQFLSGLKTKYVMEQFLNTYNKDEKE